MSKRTSEREYDARNKKLDEATIRRLAKDRSPSVRGAIAERKSLPEDVVEALSIDSSVQVRTVMAARAKLPDAILIALAGDAETAVQAIVARRRGLPEEARKRLASCRDRLISSLGSLPPDRTEDDAALATVRNGNAKERESVALRHGILPEEIQKRLAADPNPDVRKALARRRELSRELIMRLARDGAPAVRQALLGRRELPPVAILLVALDGQSHVRDMAMRMLPALSAHEKIEARAICERSAPELIPKIEAALASKQ
jgi:hypothetical protein